MPPGPAATAAVALDGPSMMDEHVGRSGTAAAAGSVGCVVASGCMVAR
jgi:hypothetical protein